MDNATPLVPGRMLLHYRLVEPIGQGGMGIVWKALDTTLDRHVALKTLPTKVVQDPDRLSRLEREAKLLASLNHPNIATIYGLHDSAGIRFLTMELVPGHDLSYRLSTHRLPLKTALRVAMDIASAIEAAHHRGIVHRDLKPGNIRVVDDHTVKVLDFGIAKALLPDGADPLSTVVSTAPGDTAVVGTPAYMSPEQALGQPLDRRSDIWSLGCVLYEMLCGERAFARITATDTIAAVISAEPNWRALPLSTPPPVTSLLRRCLEKDLGRRLSDITVFKHILADVLAHADSGERSAVQMTPSVAVLPFVNMSGDPDNQYFSDGLSEELISALMRLPDLKVASRTSAFRFRGGNDDIRRIGDELGVSTVVEGSVRRSGPRLRVAVQLIKVADGYQLWSERYDRQMADVFEIQDDIVSAVVAALVPALRGRTGHAVRRPTDNLAAYELYLRGRHFVHQRSPGMMRTAIQAFEQAIALDSDYVLAFAGLVECFALLATYGFAPPDVMRPRALAAIERATTLDPTLPEVHYGRGLLAMWLSSHWRLAETHFRNAVAADDRSSLLQVYCGLCLATVEKPDEAEFHLQRAAMLDPLSPVVQALAALAWYVSNRLQVAEESARRALEMQPGYLIALWVLALISYRQERVDEGIVLAERAVEQIRAPIFLGILGLGYGLARRADDARRLVAELNDRESRGEYVVPAARLYIQAGLKNHTELRRCLELFRAESRGVSFFHGCAPWIVEIARDDSEVARLLDMVLDKTAS